MTVLLVNPSFTGLVSKKGQLYNWAFPPLDLLNLSAILKSRGIDTKVLDLRVSPLPKEDLIREFELASQIILTTSPLDRWQCPNIDLRPVFALTDLIKDKKKLIVTGVHGTVFPEYILARTQAGVLIKGEPEIFFGIDTSSLDHLPAPDYGAVDIKKYRYEFLGGSFALLQFSRGCPYDCIFCLKSMYGRGYRKKTPEKFIEEIEQAVKRARARSIYFYDLTFTADRPSVLKICELIKQRGLKFKWCCQTRAEMVDPELLAQMRSAGCELVHFGVESGSKRISRLLEKRTDLEEIKRGFKACKKAGIRTAGFFMFGFPSETAADMEETIDLALELDPDYASFHIAIPYAGTKFYEMTGQTERYPEMYAKEVPREQLKKVQRKAFARFYLRPGYVFKKRPFELMSKAKLFLGFMR